MKKIAPVLVVVIAAAACGKSEPPPKTNDERPRCATHADCIITTFSNCCACCEAAPHAMLKNELAKKEGQCAVAECQKQCGANIECPDNPRIDTFVATCSEGTCTATKKK